MSDIFMLDPGPTADRLLVEAVPYGMLGYKKSGDKLRSKI